MDKKKTKTLIIIFLCLALVISFWIITFKLNLENGWKFSPRSGLSFEELRNEIGKIWDKSPLSKAPDTKGNKQEKIDELTEKLAEELKNLEEGETADWLTYTNEEYGFEFKYPENIKITPQPEHGTISLFRIYFFKDNNLAYNLLITSRDEVERQECFKEIGSIDINTKKWDVFNFLCAYTDTGQEKFTHYKTLHDDLNFEISIGGFARDKDFEQILSTFEFLP